MNIVLALPLPLRIAGVVALGLFAGGLAGWVAERLRSARPAEGASPARSWRAWLPIVGWFGAAAPRGRGKPIVAQLLVGLEWGALYYWEIAALGSIAGLVEPSWSVPGPSLWRTLHLEFAAHAVLSWFMLAASLVDLDELTIPDEITVPGTVLGLLIAALAPSSMLPQRIDAQVLLEPITATGWEFTFHRMGPTAPRDFPPLLAGAPSGTSLAIALGCYLAWIAALLLPPWRSRRGAAIALLLQWSRACRAARHDRLYQVVIALGVIGACGVAWCWTRGGVAWEGLLTALIGLAVGGGLIWAVRLIGQWSLGKEAMGFGDVTLLAMVGAFIGWQGVLFVFFLAPMVGLVCGVVYLVMHGRQHIPFGPFLCLATLATIAAWAPLWIRAEPYFALGWLIPQVMVGCLVLLGVLLALLRGAKALLGVSS